MVSAEIDERILKVLGGQRYQVHRDYHHPGHPYSFIEVLGASGEIGLAVLLDHGYTLSFGYHHCHYSMEDEEDICDLAETIDGILHNRICAVSIGHRKKNGRFMLYCSTFAASDEAESGDAEILFSDADYCSSIGRHSIEMLLEYWDGSKNRSVLLCRDEK